MNRAENLNGLVGIRHFCADQSSFVRRALSVGIPRRGIPRARDNQLIVVNLAIFNFDPVGKRTTWRFGETDALGSCGPGRRIPFVTRERAGMATLDLLQQLIVELLHPVHDKAGLQTARSSAAER